MATPSTPAFLHGLDTMKSPPILLLGGDLAPARSCGPSARRRGGDHWWRWTGRHPLLRFRFEVLILPVQRPVGEGQGFQRGLSGAGGGGERGQGAGGKLGRQALMLDMK